jgi:hypothetical protein
VGLGRQRRPEGGRVLGVGVDEDGPPERLTDELGHERHARPAPDEQHPVDVGRREPGRRDGPPQGGCALLQQRPDHGLELGAGDAHLVVEAG